MKISRQWSMVWVMVILVIAWSCQKEDLSPEKDKSFNETSMQGMTKLGRQLENPYSVENMLKAYSNLKSANSSGKASAEEIEITTTHFYIRFKPKNEEELAILKRDSTLILYEHPLDYEILEAGTYYHDPSVPAGIPTYQYLSLPVNKQIPEGVEYEILEELFIPDEYKDSDIPNGRIASIEFIETLIDESLRITGNLDDASIQNGRVQARSWRPAGRIRVWDNSSSPNNWRPVEGVEVKARRWFTTHKGTTNSQGYYSCDGTFKRDANYSLDWERHQFALREGWLDGANINGPKKDGNWDLDLNGGANTFHARVFMAAYHYYYKDIKGLRRPPENGTFKTKMHIRCYNEDNGSNGSHKEERRFLGLGNQVKIYNPDRAISEIYATTIHELSHASHWNMWRKGEVFDDTQSKVKESWARGVQWELTRMVWPNYKAPGGSTEYTLVVVDMIDPNYPSNSLRDNLTNGLWNDNVTGYTIRQIEDALIAQKTWNAWRDNIKSKYDNATENNLDALFANWN